MNSQSRTFPFPASAGILLVIVAICLASTPTRASAASISGEYYAEVPVGPVFCYSSATIYGPSTGPKTVNFGAGAWGSGSYTFYGLEPGEYRIGATVNCMGELDHNVGYSSTDFYGGAHSLSDATPIRVNEGSNRTRINIMPEGGSVAGTVTDSTGKPLAGICVLSYDKNGNVGPTGGTGTDGRYEIGALSTGDYWLGFSECLNPDSLVIPEYYGDKKTLAESEPVSVEYGGEYSNVDAQLAVKDPPPPPPLPDPVIEKALIGKVKVKGPARVEKGRKATFRLEITNSGNAAASGVVLEARGMGNAAGMSVGTIPANATSNVSIRLKPTKTGKGKFTFKVSSTNAGGKSIKRSITVRK